MESVIQHLDTIILGATKRRATKWANMYKTFKAELILKFGKEPTWDDAAALAKTQISNYEKVRVKAAEDGIEYTAPADEIDFLNEFVPTQLTDVEIRHFFKKSGLTNKGQLMKEIKDKYPNQYDRKLAAQIAGEFNKTDKVS